MKPAGDTLYWHDLMLCEKTLTADHVMRGERVRLVMHEKLQKMLLATFFLCPLSQSCVSQDVWLKRKQHKVMAGSPEFYAQVGCMIRQRGLLANLSLKENLLLPFLYSDQRGVLEQAEKDLKQVAHFLEIEGILNEKAGERPPYMHGLMGLGHCLLKKPNIVVTQELHLGMQSEYAARFRRKVLKALKILNPGVLYLTSSKSDIFGLPFHRSYHIASDMDAHMGWS